MRNFHKVLPLVAFIAFQFTFAQDSEEVVQDPAPEAPVAAEPEPESAPVPQESAPVAVEESAPVAVEEPAPVAVVEPVAQQAVVAPAEPSEFSFKMGLRVGVGISQFRNHVALRTVNNFYVLELDPGIASSVSLQAQFGINKLLSIVPELQYSFYTAGAELKVENKTGFDDLYTVGVEMHALELPVLAYFDLGGAYAEVGPQIGFNLYSKIYKNASYYRPDLNLLAFGLAAGGGVDLNGLLLGVRGYFGFLEYAKDAKGVPWSVQLGIGRFF